MGPEIPLKSPREVTGASESGDEPWVEGLGQRNPDQRLRKLRTRRRAALMAKKGHLRGYLA
jgi:hypothetical protein